MKRKVSLLIVLLILTSITMTGCFFSSDTDDVVDDKDQATLTINIDGEGEVASLSEGSHQFDKNTVVDLVALPDSGWEFSEWEGDVKDADDAETSILMSCDQSVTVVFIEDEDDPDPEGEITGVDIARVSGRKYSFDIRYEGDLEWFDTEFFHDGDSIAIRQGDSFNHTFSSSLVGEDIHVEVEAGNGATDSYSTSFTVKDDDPDDEVSFSYSRSGTRIYEFKPTDPDGAEYWEWKFPETYYGWDGYVSPQKVVHEFDEYGDNLVMLRILDENREEIGVYSKEITVK